MSHADAVGRRTITLRTSRNSCRRRMRHGHAGVETTVPRVKDIVAQGSHAEEETCDGHISHPAMYNHTGADGGVSQRINPDPHVR